MKNKRGELLSEETVKILMAVIGIGILLFMSYKVYGMFKQDTKAEQAKASLDEVIGLTKNLEEGKEITSLIYNPEDWYLVSYNKEIIDKDSNKGMPSQCNQKDCLCLCPAYLDVESHQPGLPDYFYYSDKRASKGLKSCEEKGVCVNSENIFIENLFEYETTFAYGEQVVNWISLLNPPIDIKLKKENNKVIISELK